MDEEEEEEIPPKKKQKHLRSIAHEHFAEQELVFLSLDVETGGENVGLIQLSCVSVSEKKSEFQQKNLNSAKAVGSNRRPAMFSLRPTLLPAIWAHLPVRSGEYYCTYVHYTYVHCTISVFKPMEKSPVRANF